MLLGAALMWVLNRWLPLVRWIAPPWSRWSSVLYVLGVTVIAAAMLRFRRSHTTINPMDPGAATHLVTDGIFRVSRNPMYVGLTLLLAGWGISLGSASVWVILPLFVLYITRAQIIPEERALEARFANEYRAYRQRVPRWIGHTRGGLS